MVAAQCCGLMRQSDDNAGSVDLFAASAGSAKVESVGEIARH
jgi:hypothetical protein